MFNLSKDSEIKDLRFYVYDFMSKSGFGDGDSILKEEEEIVEHLCRKLAKEIGVVDNRWEPLVISTSYNPFYITFQELQTGEIVRFYDMDEREKRKIERRVDEIMETPC